MKLRIKNIIKGNRRVTELLGTLHQEKLDPTVNDLKNLSLTFTEKSMLKSPFFALLPETLLGGSRISLSVFCFIR
jgi:hypothetical protein